MKTKRYLEHIRLELKNIACFRHLQIDLQSGQVTQVEGGNGRGKSTLLNCLRDTSSGGPCKVPDWLVTDCEDLGTMAANLDEITVRRDIKSGETATTLQVLDAGGLPLAKAATALREMFGDGSYLNPVTLVAMRPEDRTKAIAAALDINPQAAAQAIAAITGSTPDIQTRGDIFPAIAKAHDAYYTMRHDAKKDAEKAEAQADGVLRYLPAEWLDSKDGQVPKPVRPDDLGDIHDKKRAAELRNGQRAQLADDITDLEASVRRATDALAGDQMQREQKQQDLDALGARECETEIEEQIRRLQQQLAEMQGRNLQRRTLAGAIGNIDDAITRMRAGIASTEQRLAAKRAQEAELGAHQDVSEYQEKINAWQQTMDEYSHALEIHGDFYSRWRNADELREKAKEHTAEWERLEWIVKAIDNLPIKLLEGVKLPIDGMAILGSDIYLPDGDALRKFEAFGEADRYRFAARFAMELAPVNILLLDGIEKCDEDRRLDLYRMAAEAGFIVFSTLVTRGPLKITQLTGSDLAPAAE